MKASNISPLICFFVKANDSENIRPVHISLYMALYMQRNVSSSSPTMFINRAEIMRVAKIKSKACYHKCVQELVKWGFIEYSPAESVQKYGLCRMTLLSIPAIQKKSFATNILEKED